ncbi:MAG TPA: hypothetical protein VJT73_20330 [Polyangiaceae bacterium]|nr:hypothetical protein [Polyangiaceae bacterium]
MGSVAQKLTTDCSVYNSVTAGLAEATVACLGHVGPFDYRVVQSMPVPGAPAPFPRLMRAFDLCGPNRSEVETAQLLLRIDNLLAIQDHAQSLDPQIYPSVTACIPNAFLEAQKQIQGLGDVICPNLAKEYVANTPTAANVERLRKLLPARVPLGPQGVLGIPPGGFGPKSRFPKSYVFYRASYDERLPGQPPPRQASCGRIESCAKTCASVLAGFFLGRFGNALVTDPDYWTDPSEYGFDHGGINPYLKDNGFWHPMAESPKPPGVVFGVFQRGVDPAVQAMNGWSNEECTYWTQWGGLIGRLNPYPPIPVSERLMVSRCEPY